MTTTSASGDSHIRGFKFSALSLYKPFGDPILMSEYPLRMDDIGSDSKHVPLDSKESGKPKKSPNGEKKKKKNGKTSK